MAKITKYVDEANKCAEYVLDGHSLVVSPNPARTVFSKLELAQMIEEDISFFWSNKCFRLFNEIEMQTKSLTLVERTKLKIAPTNPEKSWYRQTMSMFEQEIRELNSAIINKIQFCLKSNNMQELGDLISDKIPEDYKGFFTQGAWFEILVFSLFRQLKSKNAEFEDAEELLNHLIAGNSGLHHEVDVTVIAPKHVTVVEVKAGKSVGAGDLMKLSGKKADLNADVGVLVSLAKFPHKREQSDNLFIFDEASNYDFDAAINVINGYYR